MTLAPEKLRSIDHLLLEYFDDKQCITAAYAQKRLLNDDDHDEVSRAYVSQRLINLAEHNHAQNLLDTELYELVDDPRGDDDDSK
ncbi:hypothetical protein [Haladaptatus pallidirubidus]|uniref:hypothetical protein n=1 Tax=Haladaptatus pallidirubidus TaxID=1008152 RepID=UPI001D101941|nr:hypothetical protein [Haladaptatus pallidirubidus]